MELPFGQLSAGYCALLLGATVVVFVLRAQRRQRIERAKRNFERLKQMLETDTAQ